MKGFKYVLAIAFLCTAFIANAATIRTYNNTGQNIRVHVNDQVQDVKKDNKSGVYWNVGLNPITQVWWEELDRSGNVMASWIATKARMDTMAVEGNVGLAAGGKYVWNKTLYNASNSYRNPQLLAAEGQAMMIDFIKSQPKEEQVCWTFAITLGSANPSGMEMIKNNCLKEKPEDQKKLFIAQFATAQAVAQGKTPAPMPQDVQTLYDRVVGGWLLAPVRVNMSAVTMAKDEVIKPLNYNSATLGILLGNEIDTDAMGKLKGSLVALILGIVLSIITFGGASGITAVGVAGLVAEVATNIATTVPDLVSAGMALQKEGQK